MLKLKLIKNISFKGTSFASFYSHIAKTFFRRKSDNIKDYEIERAKYYKDLKEYRKKNQRLFWENQTNIENDYIEKHYEEFNKKHYRDQAKFNNSIIRDAMKTYINIVIIVII